MHAPVCTYLKKNNNENTTNSRGHWHPNPHDLITVVCSPGFGASCIHCLPCQLTFPSIFPRVVLLLAFRCFSGALLWRPVLVFFLGVGEEVFKQHSYWLHSPFCAGTAYRAEPAEHPRRHSGGSKPGIGGAPAAASRAPGPTPRPHPPSNQLQKSKQRNTGRKVGRRGCQCSGCSLRGIANALDRAEEKIFSNGESEGDSVSVCSSTLGAWPDLESGLSSNDPEDDGSSSEGSEDD